MPVKMEKRRRLTVSSLHPLDWLLIAVPLAFAIRFVPAWNNETVLFFVSGLAIIPLAGWMSRATENLGERTGYGIGGLLNATFGNAPELIIALMALSKGLISLVKASIIGSILGNILFILGLSMLAGGIRYPHLRFNQTGVRVAATSLSLATIGLIIPTVFHFSVEHQAGPWRPAAEQNLSLAIAAVLLATYVLWLSFSLITHKQLFLGQKPEETGPGEATLRWSLSKSILILALTTLGIAVMSEFLAGSVESTCQSLGLTDVFVGVIIISLIGNAGESAAIMVALKNKMDLSLSITIGSSLQIALFVMPLLVLASHLLGRPMTLEFSLPEIASLVLAVGIVVIISGDGECNWLEGAQLFSVYLIIAILFFFLPASPPGAAGRPETQAPAQIKASAE
jgi:Ca2+:H+ antiporter